ncbi:MAG: hypothetical protein JNL21_05820 [Myxococcales bacterium]|nr:hypothetical protein [Myxococcales bacterium]
MNTTHLARLTALLGLLLVAGCNKADAASEKKNDSDTTTTKADAKKDDKPRASNKKDVEMVETDLSSKGLEWKGYAIMAPKDAKIMDDRGDCRVAAKGFSVILSQKPERSTIDGKKKELDKVAAATEGKVTYANESATGFDYKLETPKSSRDDFFMVLDVGGKKIGCYPLNLIKKEEMEKAREACKTLVKK